MPAYERLRQRKALIAKRMSLCKDHFTPPDNPFANLEPPQNEADIVQHYIIAVATELVTGAAQLAQRFAPNAG